MNPESFNVEPNSVEVTLIKDGRHSVTWPLNYTTLLHVFTKLHPPITERYLCHVTLHRPISDHRVTETAKNPIKCLSSWQHFLTIWVAANWRMSARITCGVARTSGVTWSSSRTRCHLLLRCRSRASPLEVPGRMRVWEWAQLSRVPVPTGLWGFRSDGCRHAAQPTTSHHIHCDTATTFSHNDVIPEFPNLPPLSLSEVSYCKGYCLAVRQFGDAVPVSGFHLDQSRDRYS